MHRVVVGIEPVYQACQTKRRCHLIVHIFSYLSSSDFPCHHRLRLIYMRDHSDLKLDKITKNLQSANLIDTLGDRDERTEH